MKYLRVGRIRGGTAFSSNYERDDSPVESAELQNIDLPIMYYFRRIVPFVSNRKIRQVGLTKENENYFRYRYADLSDRIRVCH